MWFDQIVLSAENNIVSSRVRIVRNFDNYLFPAKLGREDAKEIVKMSMDELGDLGKDGVLLKKYLHQMSDVQRMALRERRVINSTAAKKRDAIGLLLSENEALSVVINGDDHIRLQMVGCGICLNQLWERVNEIDDQINERFPYAFDEKYGYMTSYLTNMGTGLKANIILHLPVLARNRGIDKLVNSLSRFGVTVRSVYTANGESIGSFFDVSNTKTLGQSEKEIIDQIKRVALRLNAHEMEARKKELEEHSIDVSDRVYRSYGILKYARKLSLKDALTHLSVVMRGASDHILIGSHLESLYALTIKIQPANILERADGNLGKEEVDIARADYVREYLDRIMCE